MCSQRPPHSYSQQLCDMYKETLDEYINSTSRSIDFTLMIYVLDSSKKFHRMHVGSSKSIAFLEGPTRMRQYFWRVRATWLMIIRPTYSCKLAGFLAELYF